MQSSPGVDGFVFDKASFNSFNVNLALYGSLEFAPKSRRT